MDREQHARFLEYLERYTYFGKLVRKVPSDEYARLDAELQLLERIHEDHRTDEEAARWNELAALLFRD